jgi:hypothetical protein
MSNIVSVSEGKIALYAIGDSNVYVDVVFKDETFWMTQKAIADLFDVNVPAINKHLKNIFAEEELLPETTISVLEIVQREGGRDVRRSPEFYSLDAIIAIDYRVNSQKATAIYEEFRIQQNKDYISNFDEAMSKYLRGKDEQTKGKWHGRIEEKIRYSLRGIC